VMKIKDELPPDGRMLLYASDGGGTFMGFLNFGHVRAAAEALGSSGTDNHKPTP
jgi:hypothetical protein